MNFLACDGTWTSAAGGIACDGTLVAITSQEIAEELGSPALSLEETEMLIDATLILFAMVFGFLVIKKLL